MAIVERDASQKTPHRFVHKLSKDLPSFLHRTIGQLIRTELTKDLPAHLLTLRKELNAEEANRPADAKARAGAEGGE